MGVIKQAMPRLGCGASLVLPLLLVTSASAQIRSEGMEAWGDREIHYELRARQEPSIGFKKNRDECRITLDTDGVSRRLLLKDDAIVVNGTHRDTGSYSAVSLSAEKAFVIVTVSKTWTHESSHSSSHSTVSDSVHSSSGSSSANRSSGRSVLALGFTDFNGEIEFRLEGGDSIESRITTGSQQCVIEFDIDDGKNKRSIVVQPGSIEVDGERRKIGDYSKLLMTARKSRSSLRIKVDEKEIWASR